LVIPRRALNNLQPKLLVAVERIITQRVSLLRKTEKAQNAEKKLFIFSGSYLYY